MITTPSIKLDVLVPQGRDAYIDYNDGVSIPADDDHAPINFHAMAAATHGTFHVSIDTVKHDRRAILVLLTRKFDRALAAIITLKKRGHVVLASWKECGTHQIDQQMKSRSNRSCFEGITSLVDGWIAPSEAARMFLSHHAKSARIIELPTPYPLEIPSWNQHNSWKDRTGVFIGTREWNVPSRRHAVSMRLAYALASRHKDLTITCVNTGGMMGRFRSWQLAKGSVTPLAPMSYTNYLQHLSTVRLVLQRDQSHVPGQVAGDCLLASTPCIGGNGMIDSLAFPHLPDASSSDDEILFTASALLNDESRWKRTMDTALTLAKERCSFTSFYSQWTTHAKSLGIKP